MIKESYMLLGPELGEKKDTIDQIRADIRQKYGDNIEEYTYYPYDTDMTEVIGVAQGISMFSSFKLIIINDCAGFKKKDVDLFLAYLKKPAVDTTIIFTDDGMKCDAKLEKAVGEKKIFWELSENQCRSYVQSYFYRQKKRIDQDAAALIAENCENNTLSIKNECDKIALFLESKEEISTQDIENFLFYNREDNVFTLFDHILVSDLNKTADVAKTLMLSSDGDPVQLLGGLTWQFKRLLDVHIQMDAGVSLQEACLKNRITSKKVQAKIKAGAERYSTKALEHILSRCTYYDQQFRSVKKEMQETLFPLFLYEVMVKKGY
mgnify:CR=1 FL=1